MTKHLIYIILIICSSAYSANAWEYNFSNSTSDRNDLNNDPRLSSYYNSIWFDTGDSGASGQCGTSSGTASTYRVYPDPDRTCWTTRYQSGVADEFKARAKNPSCFKYSCYYQAFSYVKDAPMPIQPLTKDLELIKSIIKGNDLEPRSSSKSGITEDKIGAKINTGGYPWGSYGAEWLRPYTIDVGAGTSAMQGLLWSWRSLSSEWEGVWKEKSDYEQLNNAAELRLKLPSRENSKHIIIISDGADSDGTDNYNKEKYNNNWPHMKNLPVVTNNTSPNSYRKGFYKDVNGDFGYVLPGYVSPSSKIEVPFDTCDAHVPDTSIDASDYAALCTKLKDQGIKVHTILYDYAENISLQDCSTTTGGEFAANVAPAALEDVLNDVFLSIYSAQIRLTK